MVIVKKCDDSDCDKVFYKKSNRDMYTSMHPKDLSTHKSYLSSPTVAKINIHM